MSRPYDSHGIATVPSTVIQPRIFLFGIRCQFTETVLHRLIARNASVVGVVLPAPPALATPLRSAAPRLMLPMANVARPGSTLSQQVVYQLGSLRSQESLALVRSLRPDVIVVACFPRRIPTAISRQATWGALNIHPSLLPENRGPDPLFWAFKRGDGRFGVTVHTLSPRYDAGDVVGQHAFAGWHGISELDVERTLARYGADLALRVIGDGTRPLETVPQDESQATYQSWPSIEDYRIDQSRPAAVAYNFVKGVTERGVPIYASIEDHDVVVIDALSHHFDQRFTLHDSDVRAIPCSPGSMVARIQGDS